MKKTWTQWEGNLVDTFFFFYSLCELGQNGILAIPPGP